MGFIISEAVAIAATTQQDSTSQKGQEPIWRQEYPFASHRIGIADHLIHYVDEGKREREHSSDRTGADSAQLATSNQDFQANDAIAARPDDGTTHSTIANSSQPTVDTCTAPSSSATEGLQNPASSEARQRTFLFVHGNPTWSFYWRNLIQGLSNQHRCIAIDHLGCGLSDKPQNYDYCLDNHIQNLLELIRQLDLRRVTLVAHDWGGAIGMGAAVAEPDRIEQIALLNTAAFPPPYVPLRIQCCRIPVLGPLALRGLNLFSRSAMTMAIEDPSGLSSIAKAGLLAPYDSWANRVAVNRFVQDIPSSKSHRTWKKLSEIEEKLPSLSHCPIHLIWGMKDWCFRPECMERFQAIWPHAKALPIETAGHFVVEEATDQVLNSLKQLVATPSIASPAKPAVE